MTMLNTEIMQAVRTVTITPDQIHIDSKDIIRNLGYKEVEPPSFVRDSIEQELIGIGRYIEVNAGYTIRPLVRQQDKSVLDIGGVHFRTGKIISAQMNRAEYSALFLCTIGPGLEERVKTLMNEGDTFNSTVVDFIASEAAEKAVDELVEQLRIEMEPLGLGVTYPFSPGYCGWQVAEQPLLFSFFPEKPFGITLKTSNLMVPMKSVSGIVGIGREAKQRVYPCNICTFKDCYKNRS